MLKGKCQWIHDDFIGVAVKYMEALQINWQSSGNAMNIIINAQPSFMVSLYTVATKDDKYLVNIGYGEYFLIY